MAFPEIIYSWYPPIGRRPHKKSHTQWNLTLPNVSPGEHYRRRHRKHIYSPFRSCPNWKQLLKLLMVYICDFIVVKKDLQVILLPMTIETIVTHDPLLKYILKSTIIFFHCTKFWKHLWTISKIKFVPSSANSQGWSSH